MATNASATTAPGGEGQQARRTGRRGLRRARPRRPKANSRATPPTTGGSTIGQDDQGPDAGDGRGTSAGPAPRPGARRGRWTRQRRRASTTSDSRSASRGLGAAQLVPSDRPRRPLEQPDERQRRSKATAPAASDGGDGADSRRARQTRGAGSRPPPATCCPSPEHGDSTKARRRGSVPVVRHHRDRVGGDHVGRRRGWSCPRPSGRPRTRRSRRRRRRRPRRSATLAGAAFTSSSSDTGVTVTPRRRGPAGVAAGGHTSAGQHAPTGPGSARSARPGDVRGVARRPRRSAAGCGRTSPAAVDQAGLHQLVHGLGVGGREHVGRRARVICVRQRVGAGEAEGQVQSRVGGRRGSASSSARRPRSARPRRRRGGTR